jgi:hypothetical protein
MPRSTRNTGKEWSKAEVAELNATAKEELKRYEKRAA